MLKFSFNKRGHTAYFRITQDTTYSLNTFPGIQPSEDRVPVTKNSYLVYIDDVPENVQEHVEDARAYLKEHGEKVLYVLELEVPGTSLSTCRREEFDVNTSTDEVSRRIYELIPTMTATLRKDIPAYISDLERALEAARKALTEDDTELAD